MGRSLPQEDNNDHVNQDIQREALEVDLAKCYQSNSLQKENKAQDIDSTSSATIKFNNIMKRPSESSVMGPPSIIGQKKKRIKVTSNKSITVKEENVEQGTSKEEAESATVNNAMVYVRRLKKLLSEEEMKQLKAGMTEYKKKKQFDVLVPLLKNVILAYQSKDMNLIRDFKVFISREHLSDFDLFCNVTAASL